MYGQLLLYVLLIKITSTKPYVSDVQLMKDSSLQEKRVIRSPAATSTQNDDYGEQQNIDPGTRITLKGGDGGIYFFGDCHIWIEDEQAMYREGQQEEVRVPNSVPLYLTREAYIRFSDPSEWGIISFIMKKPCSVAFSWNSYPKVEKEEMDGLPDVGEIIDSSNERYQYERPTTGQISGSSEDALQKIDYGEQQNIEPGTRITLKGGSQGDRIYFFDECHIWITKAKAVYNKGQEEVRLPRSIPLYLTPESYIRFTGELKFGIISFIGKQPCSVAFSRNSEPKIEKPKKPEETTTNGYPDMRIVTEAVTQSSESTVTSTKSWEESGYTTGGALSVFIFGVVLFFFCLWIAYKSFEEGCSESTVTSTKSWEESGYTTGGATSVFVFAVVLFWFCLWIAYKSFEEGCACSCI